MLLFGEAISINNRISYTEVYDRRGIALIELGRLQPAIADFDTAIMREPTDSRAFEYRGKAYFLNNDLDRALSDLDRAITLDWSNASALVTRGDLFRRIGDPEKARADFDAIDSESGPGNQIDRFHSLRSEITSVGGLF